MEWGDGVVDELAATLARRYPGTHGYTRPNLFRMRQFHGGRLIALISASIFCITTLCDAPGARFAVSSRVAAPLEMLDAGE